MTEQNQLTQEEFEHIENARKVLEEPEMEYPIIFFYNGAFYVNDGKTVELINEVEFEDEQ